MGAINVSPCGRRISQDNNCSPTSGMADFVGDFWGSICMVAGGKRPGIVGGASGDDGWDGVRYGVDSIGEFREFGDKDRPLDDMADVEVFCDGDRIFQPVRDNEVADAVVDGGYLLYWVVVVGEENREE